MTDYLRSVNDGADKLLVNGSSLVIDDGTDPCCCEPVNPDCDAAPLWWYAEATAGDTPGDPNGLSSLACSGTSASPYVFCTNSLGNDVINQSGPSCVAASRECSYSSLTAGYLRYFSSNETITGSSCAGGSPTKNSWVLAVYCQCPPSGGGTATIRAFRQGYAADGDWWEKSFTFAAGETWFDKSPITLTPSDMIAGICVTQTVNATTCVASGPITSGPSITITANG